MSNGIEILYIEIYHFLHCVSIILNLASMRLTNIGLFPKYPAKQVRNDIMFPTFGLVFQLEYFQNMFAPQISVHCILQNISGFQICRVKPFLSSIFFFTSPTFYSCFHNYFLVSLAELIEVSK